MNYCDNVFSQKKNISMFSQGKTPHCILTAWKTHETELRHWLQRQLSDHEQAADALHDIFLKMIAREHHSAISKIQGPGYSRWREIIWLMCIAETNISFLCLNLSNQN